MNLKEAALTAWIILVFSLFPPCVEGSQPDDDYITGYASAILQQEFHITGGFLVVRDGTVTVVADDIRGAERDRLIEALKRTPGVTRVQVLSRRNTSPVVSDGARVAMLPDMKDQWFPRGQLFDPFHADPRWPHFAAAIRSYRGSGEGGLHTAFAGDFGETFALYRNRAPFGQWEFGVQAGVFSLFDIGSERKQLVNGDYLVGVLTSYRAGDWSAFVRYQHQSSHLGDEFLLSSRIRRVNVSYEVIDGKMSYDFWDTVRVYGGLGIVVRRDPSNLSPLRGQYGVELQSPWTLGSGIRPVAYADFQTSQLKANNDLWPSNFSLRAGLQFENVRICDRKLQLLAEYYRGYSPNGQFYTTRIETFGVGVHIYF